MNRATVLVILAVGLSLAALPWFTADRFILNLLILANIYTIYILGWDFLGGLAGHGSGGHALSFGGAAYLAGLLTLAGCPRLLIPPVSLVGITLVGAALGWFLRRLDGPYLLLVTLAVAEVAHELALGFGFTTPEGYTIGGEGGLPVASLLFREGERFYDYVFWISLFFLVLTVVALYWIRCSLPGLKIKALAHDVIVAQAVGLAPERFRVLAFGVGTLVGGLAGTLHVQYTGVATPSTLSLELSFVAMTMSIAGGKGTIIGPAVVSYLLNVLLGWLWVTPVVRLLLYSSLTIVAVRLFLRPWKGASLRAPKAG